MFKIPYYDQQCNKVYDEIIFYDYHSCYIIYLISVHIFYHLSTNDTKINNLFLIWNYSKFGDTVNIFAC